MGLKSSRKIRQPRRRRIVAPALLLMMMAGSGAANAADPKAGEFLAEHWCTSCHVVGDTGNGNDAAPTFQAIATRHAGDASWLKAWLAAPHPPMPNLTLSREEIDNIVAYLGTLTP